MQQAFHDCHALQCGYCTPGMIMQAIDVLNDNPNPSEEEIRVGLEGNLCRCTGYHNIVKAVQQRSRGRPGATARRVTAGGEPMTAVDERTARRDRQPPQAQGGPAPDHRSHPLDRQHQAAGHAAPRHGAQPVRPRHDHRHRHRGGAQAPGVVAVVTGADVKDSQGAIANAWPITDRPEDPGPPADRPSTTSPAPARSSPSSWPGPPRAARDAAELVRRRLRRAARRPRPKEAADGRGARPSRTSAPTSPPSGSSTPPTRAPGGDVDEAIDKARADGIVIEREYRQQRLIPAFMEPRLDGGRPDRRADHDVDLHAGPAHPAVPHRGDDRDPGVQGPGDRSRRGRRFRRQAAATPEEFVDAGRRPPGGQARQVHRDALASPSSRVTTAATSGRSSTLAATKDGTVTGLKVDLSPTSGPTSASSVAVCRPRGVDVQRDLQVPRLPVHRPDRPHQHHLGGRLPRRRPSRGDVRDRAADGRPAAEVGVDPLAIREQNWIRHDEFPFTSVAGMTYDSGNYEVATAVP